MLWDALGSALHEQFLMAGFEERRYQATSALALAASLASGRNAALQLPPGVGKTLIAQLVMAIYRRQGGTKKQLVIVPTTLLVDQHVTASSWLNPHVVVSKVSPETARRPSSIRYLAASVDVLVTTPKLFWNSLCTDILPFDYLDQLGLCFVDEYDEFVTSEEDTYRLHADFAPLFEALRRRGTLFVGLSASSPVTDTRAGHWLSLLRSDLCAPSGPDVEPYLPALHVHFCSALDLRVIGEDQRIGDAVGQALKQAERQLSEQSGHVVELDLAKLLPVLGRLVSGQKRTLHLSGRDVMILPSVRELFAQVQGSLHDRLKLFEDISAVVDVGTSVKAEGLTNLVQGRGNDLGLVMMRYIEPGEAIRQRLAFSGVECKMIHGQVDPATRALSLETLVSSEEGGILVLTRNLGGRGFDFPQADYAIFYSPKEEESVMWQEMLRIRSSRRIVKDVYILYYTGTTERDKALSLYQQLLECQVKGYRLVNLPL